MTAKRTLYISLVRLQVTYCSVIWRPNLIKDMTLIEQIQRRATKFILNDYSSDYFDRLKQLNLLPLMYTFELNVYAKVTQASLSFFEYHRLRNFLLMEIPGPPQVAKWFMLETIIMLVDIFFFNRIPRLWNALPPIDLSLPIKANKTRIIICLWLHFLSNFRHDKPCTFHFLSPCSRCSNTPHPPLM